MGTEENKQCAGCFRSIDAARFNAMLGSFHPVANTPFKHLLAEINYLQHGSTGVIKNQE